jgi:hypothetical protein
MNSDTHKHKVVLYRKVSRDFSNYVEFGITELGLGSEITAPQSWELVAVGF